MFRLHLALLASTLFLAGCCDCDDVEIVPKKTPSELRIVAPADGATVGGIVEVTVAITRPRNVGQITMQVGAAFDVYYSPPPWETPPDEHTFLWDSTATSGTATIQVFGDTQGTVAMDAVTVHIDQAPTVEILTPQEGASVAGEVEISLAIVDENTQRTVSFVGIEVERRGDLYFWDSTQHPDGAFTFKAAVVDVAGNRAESELAVSIDNTGPVLEIVSPLPEASVGPQSDLELRAEDASGVGSVAVWANGEEASRLAITAEPWRQVLDLSDLEPGPVALRAEAQDGLGNTSRVDWVVNLLECDSDDDGFAARVLACGGDDCDDEDPGVPALLPCAPAEGACDDAAEPNNSAPGALLATGTREYRACDDADYFHVEVAEGERSRIEVRFHAAEGALEPSLQDLDGEPLAESRGLERGVAWSLLGPVDAVVHVPAGSGQLYEITTYTAPAPDCDDAWDPNETREQAAMLALGSVAAFVCDAGDDWYRVGMIEGQALAFDLAGNETDGLVVATVYDPDGVQIVSDLGSDSSLSVVGHRTGFWALHVSLASPDEAYTYQLTTSEVSADASCEDDAGEPNNGPTDASGSDNIGGVVCGADVDWFDLGEVEANQPLSFLVTDDQDVSYTVLGPEGVIVQTVATTPAPAAFEVETTDAGQHFLVVRPLRVDTTADYAVTLER
jgi:hypothetical protein